MSRLDLFVDRITAQRDILNLIAAQSLLPDGGAILEIGLGNGRTYSHLLEAFSGRRVIVFDRAVASHGTSTPPAADLILGEISQTATTYAKADAAMVHADIGTGYADKDAGVQTWLPQLCVDLLMQGGVAVSGLQLVHPRLKPLDMPSGIGRNLYFAYRKQG
ncbi:hypothetical protein GCM10010873_13300 [Cypionkella aquatica]|uniref:S-adenosyl-L-methionine methyltransferase n=1 Tax=Cypionkella aquatica TaxID=1756042 RepID=A0AA37U097_9RHOB|nr:class I SAM-dependent methyltransferase [Cypionkella aquatica]GLS86356.1 hypothetical protein GCM10010873_13300 [Cypionkella aquatica]